MEAAMLDPKILHELLRYNPETGELFWRERPARFFSDTINRAAAVSSKLWNCRYANKRSFASINSSGYYTGMIFSHTYQSHRVIWAMVWGEWPAHDIDHINHDRSDNRLANLRTATRQENARNQSLRKNNTSGHTGVGWNKRACKWRARIIGKDKTEYLGNFTTKADAISARNAAEVKFGYHPNHGNARLIKEAT